MLYTYIYIYIYQYFASTSYEVTLQYKYRSNTNYCTEKLNVTHISFSILLNLTNNNNDGIDKIEKF